MRLSFRVLVALIALLLAPAARAQQTKPLFASNAMLHLTLQADFGAIFSHRNTKTRGEDGQLTVDGSAPLPVRLSPRGITRRAKATCPFAPLRVAFDQPPPSGSLFAGQKRLKLVTHCRADEAFQRYPMLEYAAYRMYNALTPLSFAVRPATITYVDAHDAPITTRFGFFIEDTDDLAARNGLVEAKVGDRLPFTRLTPADTSRVTLFDYMIGNMDFAVNAGPAGEGCCHNGKLLGQPGATANLIPIPYDFDFSGLVDAPYAKPPEAFEMKNVRERRFRGFCLYNAQTIAAAADFNAKQPAILAALDELPALEPAAKDKARAYLAGFFAQIGSPAAVTADVLGPCLK